MACIISHDAEEAVGVFVGDSLKFRGGEIENVSCLGKDVADVRARRDTRPYHGIGFDKKPVEGDFLDELAVVHGVIVQDGWAHGDKATQFDDLWNKPVRTGKPMKKE